MPSFILAPNFKGKKFYKLINDLMNLGSLGLCQVLKGTIVASFPEILPFFFTIQFFGSTLQGSISDIYKRSKILNIALIVLIFFTICLLFIQGKEDSSANIIKFICAGAIALGGNADVVGRASLIDSHFKVFRRKVMSWTVLAEAFSWVIVGFLIRFFHINPVMILIGCVCLATLLLAISFFFNMDDLSDKQHLHNPGHEIKLVIKKHFKKIVVITLAAIAGELGYFYFFYAEEDSIKDKIILADTYFSWFVSMSLGCLIPMTFKKFKDYFFLVLGLSVSFISVLAFIVFGMDSITQPGMFVTDSIIFFGVGLGSGIFLPCFYSVISNGYSVHFQGLLTGWIDSIRGFGDAFATITLLGLTMSPFVPIALSCLLFITSIILLICNKRLIEKMDKYNKSSKI